MKIYSVGWLAEHALKHIPTPVIKNIVDYYNKNFAVLKETFESKST